MGIVFIDADDLRDDAAPTIVAAEARLQRVAAAKSELPSVPEPATRGKTTRKPVMATQIQDMLGEAVRLR